MSFKTWNEYLNQSGKLVTDPKKEEVPDYHGKPAAAPLSGKKDKDMGGADKGQSKFTSYISSKSKPVKGQPMEKGLVDKGPKAVPHPKVDPVPQGKAGKVVSSPWNKEKQGPCEYPANPNKKPKMVKSEMFLSKTKDMPIGEFMQYMYEEVGVDMEDETLPMVTAYAPGKFHPHPPEAIKFIAALAKKNPRVMDALVHELKGQDGLEGLMGASMEHPETYSILTKMFGDEDKGPSRSKAFGRAMDDDYRGFREKHGLEEAVGPPFGMDDELDTGSGGPHRHKDDSMGDEDPNDDDNLEHPDADEEGDNGAGAAIGDEEGGDPGVAPEGGDDANTANEPASEDDGEAPEPFDHDGEHGQEEDKDTLPPMKKSSKKFAHHHLLDAMADHDHMKKAMKGY
jgi:hypothetical protein